MYCVKKSCVNFACVQRLCDICIFSNFVVAHFSSVHSFISWGLMKVCTKYNVFFCFVFTYSVVTLVWLCSTELLHSVNTTRLRGMECNRQYKIIFMPICHLLMNLLLISQQVHVKLSFINTLLHECVKEWVKIDFWGNSEEPACIISVQIALLWQHPQDSANSSSRQNPPSFTFFVFNPSIPHSCYCTLLVIPWKFSRKPNMRKRERVTKNTTRVSN